MTDTEPVSVIIPIKKKPTSGNSVIQLATEELVYARTVNSSSFDVSSIVEDWERRKRILEKICEYLRFQGLSDCADELAIGIEALEHKRNEFKQGLQSVFSDILSYKSDYSVFCDRLDIQRALRDLRRTNYWKDYTFLRNAICRATVEPTMNIVQNKACYLTKTLLKREVEVETSSDLYCLRIDISHLSFTFHPLMNREEFLYAKMKRLYTTTKECKNHSRKEDLNKELCELWKQVEKERSERNFIATPVTLAFESLQEEIRPVLLKTAQCTEEKQWTQTEVSRRQKIGSKFYYCHVLVNGRKVTATNSPALNSDFSVVFKTSVPIFLLKWPSSVCLKLYEKTLLSSHLLATIPIPIPQTSKKREGLELCISSKETYIPSWSAEDGRISTQAVIKCSTYWQPVEDSVVFIPRIPENPTQLSAEFNMSGNKMWKKAKKKVRQQSVDINNPWEFAFMPLLENFGTKNLERDGFFLSEQNPDICFGHSEEQERIQLLKLRCKQNIGQSIPLFDKEITPQLMEHLQQRKEKSVLSNFAQRAQNRVRGMQTSEASRTDLNKFRHPKTVLEKTVREVSLPDLTHLFRWIGEFFSPKRPLCPPRTVWKNRKNSLPESCKLLIQIVRGQNWPTRGEIQLQSFRNYRSKRLSQGASFAYRQKATRRAAHSENVDMSQTSPFLSTEPGTSTQNGDKAIPDEDGLLHPVVQLSFQNEQCWTRVVKGSHPQFNETLELEFVPSNNNFDPEHLKYCMELLYIDIFDELVIEEDKDDRDVNKVRQHTEMRWLGSYSIPFTTIYLNEKVQGIFEVNAPLFVLGYDHAPQPMSIELFVTLDPKIPLPYDNEAIDLSGEPPDIYSYANWWESSLLADRGARILVPNLDGKATLAIRYVRPLEPPSMVDTVQKAIHFVNLVPFLTDFVSFSGRQEVWTDAQEFLDIPGGDWEEHALLLCCYFLYFKLEAYVVIGQGQPEGDTAYVLTKSQDGKVELWNASTGRKYAAEDTRCPLTDIVFVFNGDNAYANIQTQEGVTGLKYDFEDPACWAPFFSSRFPKRRLHSVQPINIIYRPVTLSRAKDLENKIRKSLHDMFENWRCRDSTLWNDGVEEMLQEELLPLFERYKLGEEFPQEKHTHIINHLKKTFDIAGFPMHSNFTDVNTIATELRNTEIHQVYEETVFFALGVHVTAYVSGVYSVWIYPVSLISNRLY